MRKILYEKDYQRLPKKRLVELVCQLEQVMIEAEEEILALKDQIYRTTQISPADSYFISTTTGRSEDPCTRTIHFDDVLDAHKKISLLKGNESEKKPFTLD